MTDAGSPGTEWVPRFGMLEVSSERAALIRGLFELAAFVADHPELPLPSVAADVSGGFCDDYPEQYRRDRVLVDQLAALFGVEPTERRGHYRVQRFLGPVCVKAAAVTPEALAIHEATYSYSGAVRPASAGGEEA